MRLFVVRHGQTDINIQYRINSLNDEDINSEGIRQAESLRENMRDIDYDIIISSPLTRALHTAQIINCREKEIVVDDRIIERKAGKMTLASLNDVDNIDWWRISPVADYYDAETVVNLIERIRLFLKDIQEKYKNKNIVLVTHGGVSKAIRTCIQGVPENGSLASYSQKNCEILQFEFDE
ncbi:MAG: histidine phosphatase family protein [Clostridia bacterium]|nr:histidine phosphatase family protein [Clostridia bacterium]